MPLLSLHLLLTKCEQLPFPQVSSTRYPWLPKTRMDFSCTFVPFSFPFLAAPCNNCSVVTSCSPPISAVHSARISLSCSTSSHHRISSPSSGNGRGRDKRCSLLSPVHCFFCGSFRHRHPNCVFHQRDPTKEPQPAPPHALSCSVYLSGSEAVSCLANEPSRHHWKVTEILTTIARDSDQWIHFVLSWQMMRFHLQQLSSLRFFDGAMYSSPSRTLFLLAQIPQETPNAQYFWVEHKTCLCTGSRAAIFEAITSLRSLHRTRLCGLVGRWRWWISRDVQIFRQYLTVCRAVFTNGSKFLGKSHHLQPSQ